MRFLAANTKLPPVISIGDEGNFNTEGFVEFTQNSGNTRSGTSGNLNPAQEIQYALVNNSLLLPQMDFDDVPIIGRDTTVLLKCLPLVSTKWDQRDPYNYYAPLDNNNDEKSIAGCVPVAGAQTLASLCYHHNWRPTIQLSEVYTVDWSTINRLIFNDIIRFESGDYSSNALAVASLIRAVGEDVNDSYGSSITLAMTSLLKRTFQRLGMALPLYGNANSLPSITHSDLFNMVVTKNYPVVTSANTITEEVGHSFVLDGWLRLEYSLLLSDTEDAASMRSVELENFQFNFDLVHINLGWNGQCDGYYLPDAFDLTEDKYREYAEEQDEEHASLYVFDMNVKYLIYDL